MRGEEKKEQQKSDERITLRNIMQPQGEAFVFWRVHGGYAGMDGITSKAHILINNITSLSITSDVIILLLRTWNVEENEVKSGLRGAIQHLNN
jgi:hypothetical protein